MGKKQENKGGNKGHDNLKPCKKGETANPNGRPKGQRNYATIYKEALLMLGKLNGKTPEQLENELLATGFKHALKDYRFYKDVMDRTHGQPKQDIDLTSAGEKLQNIVYLPAKPNTNMETN